MIAECVIKPELLAEWKYFQRLHGRFGVSEGRLLCLFPLENDEWRERWKTAVTKYEEEGRNTWQQTQKIREHYINGKLSRALVDPMREFKAPDSWSDSVQQAEPKFDLVLQADPPNNNRYLNIDEYLDEDPPFYRPRQTEIQRTAKKLIETGWQCFRRAKEIYLVDPYFDVQQRSFGPVLAKFVERLDDENPPEPPRLEVHASLKPFNGTFDRRIKQNQWQNWAEKNLPSGWSLKISYWDKIETGGTMHARYILTEIGGLDYNWGMDVDESEHTQVSLLEDTLWNKLYRRFAWPGQSPNENQPKHVLEVGC